jgi:hypothetical protein
MVPTDLDVRVSDLETALRGLGRLEFGEGVGHPFRGNQYTDGESGGADVGTEKNPIPCTSAEQAIKLIGEGKYITMPPDQISVTLDKLANIANEAKARGEKAPLYDLCKISVPDTNIFCAGNKGINRINMPQFSGKATPGSLADKLPKNAKGEADIIDGFRAQLASDGFKFDDTNVAAATLKATQNELNGAKVAGMMQSIESGKLPPGRIFVSSDNYVVDGHHRWAANVGEDFRDAKGGDINIPVTRVDLPISVLIDYAKSYARHMGVQQAGA